ncbi:EFR1 family ferrodoxin [Candidatus Omnitrophota bacterium]
MKTKIYYFSGTGNSLKIARDLAGELKDTQLIPISQVISDKKIDSPAQRIGIVYPVYMWGMPLIVTNFINKLKAEKNIYIFAIATYGGVSGSALRSTADKLHAKGLLLSAGFIVMMPGNYTPLYGAIPLEKQKKMFAKAKEKVKYIAQIVKTKQTSGIETSSLFTNLIFSGLLYKLLSSQIPMSDVNYWSDKNCNGCGVCKKVCPVGNIEMVDDRPVWLHKCELCVACLQWCPQEAIQFKNSTIGRKRYRHPEVRVSDIINEHT